MGTVCVRGGKSSGGRAIQGVLGEKEEGAARGGEEEESFKKKKGPLRWEGPEEREVGAVRRPVTRQVSTR